MKSKFHKNIYNYIQKSISFVLETGALVGLIVLVILFFVARNCQAQVDFSKIPANEKFINNKASIMVKNIGLVQRDEELDCTWKTSHAQISGMLDTKTQEFLNDWLSGMTYFGNCEGDKECYDFQSYHYYYKATRVTHLQNDLLGFYLHEGNCKDEKTYCLENQDWEIYDLRGKRFLQEGDILLQDNKSQEKFFTLIESKVKKQKWNLVNDWKIYTRQIGLDNNQLIVYLNNDMLNNSKGVIVRFRIDEVQSLLVPCFANRLKNRACEEFNQPIIGHHLLKN
ncbi:hypothetical protein [Emticicia sp. BO119]|uniref:hypothetical protein n=1 Tax=Emticicia sp. BO119 TaxID=2757768 RepID=UPI0015F0B7AD|nr:hypothetical protein [Emticicia sp. BO119]MBA4848892.1 hypothetical protein [Emticicia sp. BO119]